MHNDDDVHDEDAVDADADDIQVHVSAVVLYPFLDISLDRMGWTIHAVYPVADVVDSAAMYGRLVLDISLDRKVLMTHYMTTKNYDDAVDMKDDYMMWMMYMLNFLEAKPTVRHDMLIPLIYPYPPPLFVL